MLPALSQQTVYAGFALLSAAIACVHDVRERRIPNLLTVPAMFTGFLLHFVFGGWGALGSALLAGLLGGGVFFLFFLAGGMGAGDVKLMAAVGSIVALGAIPCVLLVTVFAAALFALGISVRDGKMVETVRNVIALIAHHRRRGLTPHPEINVSNSKTSRLPFALPVMTGCVVYLLTLVLGVNP